MNFIKVLLSDKLKPLNQLNQLNNTTMKTQRKMMGVLTSKTNCIRKIFLCLSILIIGLSSQAQIANMLLNKMASGGPDEKYATTIDLFSDKAATQKISEIVDGTKLLLFRCNIPEEATKLKKPMNQTEFTYTFTVTVKSATVSVDLIGGQLIQSGGGISSWKDLYNGKRSMDFEMEGNDSRDGLLMYLKNSDGKLNKEEIVLEATLISNHFSGAKVLSKSEFKLTLDGDDGKYANASLASAIESYKPGGYNAPKIHDKNMNARVLKYAKEHDPNSDISHIAIISQTEYPLKGERIIIANVTYRTIEGKCSTAMVDIYETLSNNALSSYMPRAFSTVDCDIMDAIRNVN